MRTNQLAVAAYSALVCVLAWTVLGKPPAAQSYADKPVVTTGIRWEREPANCQGDCLKGYQWGIRQEVTERKDCRALESDVLTQ